MQEIIDYFNHPKSNTAEYQSDIKTLVQVKYFDKGDVLLDINSIKKEHYFVAEGCLRSFYTTPKGKELTVQFAIKNWWIGDYISIYNNQDSILTIECLTAVKVLVIDRKKMDEFLIKYPEIETFLQNNLQRHIASLQKRIISLLAFTGLEKYNSFLEDYAAFEKVIPNYYIASYLGITPESLSRIRKNRVKI